MLESCTVSKMIFSISYEGTVSKMIFSISCDPLIHVFEAGYANTIKLYQVPGTYLMLMVARGNSFMRDKSRRDLLIGGCEGILI